MKKMIKMAMMAAAMFAVVTTTAKAQGGGGGGGGRGGRMNPLVVLKDSMHVSDAILAKADSIIKAAAAESAPLGEAARGGDADARAKMQAINTKRTEAIKALLSDEQKAAYDKFMPPMGRRGGL
jgi:hypothetical protein